MDPTLSVDTTGFNTALKNYERATLRGAAHALQHAARMFIRRAAGLTPPATFAERGRGGRLTHADKKRGEIALQRDLSSLFVPVKLTGARTEQHPDVAAIHRRHFLRKKSPGKSLRPDGRQKFYVDKNKLKALTRELLTRVGRLAAGWLAGAEAVGETLPSWVTRHGNRGGTARLMIQTHGIYFTVAHTSVAPKALGELRRRVDYALADTGRALEQEVETMLAKQSSL